VFARYAADHDFSEIDELGTRDGADLVVTDDDGNEIFAPVVLDVDHDRGVPQPAGDLAGRRVAHHAAVQRAGGLRLPEGIGPVECVNVEHEEVLLMPRWVDCKRATFKYGLGDEFINILKVLHTLGLDRTEKVRVKGVEVSPRDVVAAVLPDPATVGPRMKGKTCAGLWVTGKGKDGEPGRRTSTTWSTTSGRCRSTATSAWSGRPRSTRSSPSSCSQRHLDARGVLGPGGVRRGCRSSTAHRVRLAVGAASEVEWLSDLLRRSARDMTETTSETYHAVDELELEIATVSSSSPCSASPAPATTTVLRLIAGFESPTSGPGPAPARTTCSQTLPPHRRDVNTVSPGLQRSSPT
jgi:hypothetical protein